MKNAQFVTCSLDTIFYCIFADGSPQTWNEPNSNSQEKKEENKPKRDWFLVSLNCFELPIMNEYVLDSLDSVGDTRRISVCYNISCITFKEYVKNTPI